MTLAAIPTKGKKMCLDRTIQGKSIIPHKKRIQIFLADKPDGILDDFWVYGTDSGCSPGNMHWCSILKPFQPKEVTWAAGEPSTAGGCVYMKSSNLSSLATANCNMEMRFLCDARKMNGSSGIAMQQECLETWNVSPSKKATSFHLF
jgi:hypothetical protein